MPRPLATARGAEIGAHVRYTRCVHAGHFSHRLQNLQKRRHPKQRGWRAGERGRGRLGTAQIHEIVIRLYIIDLKKLRTKLETNAQWSISHMPQLHFCALSGLSRMNESSAPPQTQGHTRTHSDCDTLVSLLSHPTPHGAHFCKCLPARSTVNGTPSTFISGRRRLHWGQIGDPRPVDAPVQP